MTKEEKRKCIKKLEDAYAAMKYAEVWMDHKEQAVSIEITIQIQALMRQIDHIT